MGLIGIKIRIATKEKLVPEFKLKTLSEISTKITKQEDKDEHIAETETEQIKIEEEKMKKLVTLEEEEERLK
jgi:small subunit ribosomal protein S3